MLTLSLFFAEILKSLNDNSPAITACASAVIAAFTATLWFATREQGKLTKETLIADKRAFVFAAGIKPEWQLKNGYLHWTIRPVWQNTGDTPTRNLRICSDSELRDDVAPADYCFETKLSAGTGMLGPKAFNFGGAVPLAPKPILSPEDLVGIRDGKKHFYMFGWAKYFDVFPNTFEHETRFSWQVFVVGDPWKLEPDDQGGYRSHIAFSYINLRTGNCADEECDKASNLLT
jgi:hypothetical protein